MTGTLFDTLKADVSNWASTFVLEDLLRKAGCILRLGLAAQIGQSIESEEKISLGARIEVKFWRQVSLANQADPDIRRDQESYCPFVMPASHAAQLTRRRLVNSSQRSSRFDKMPDDQSRDVEQGFPRAADQ